MFFKTIFEKTIKSSLLLILVSSTADAFTIDSNRFFAYFLTPRHQTRFLLSHEKCPLTGKDLGWNGYAQMVYGDGKEINSCWSGGDEKEPNIAVCPISIDDNVAIISDCYYIGKEFFTDVESLPKRAF